MSPRRAQASSSGPTAPALSSGGVDVIEVTEQRLSSVHNMDAYVDALDALCKETAGQPLTQSQEKARTILLEENAKMGRTATYLDGPVFERTKNAFLNRLAAA